LWDEVPSVLATTAACVLLLVGEPITIPRACASPLRSTDARAHAATDPGAAGAPSQGEAPPTGKSPAPPERSGLRVLASGILEDVTNLPSMSNLYLAALGGGLAAAVHPLDDDVNASLRGLEDVWVPGEYIGNAAVQLGAAVTVYAVGRVRHQGKAAHLGMDLMRAQIVASGITVGLKYATQRERPDGSDTHAFPSGHASVTFATATVLERHLGWRAGVPAYAVASYVSASRLHDNRHYLSDVVFGAAVGAIGGRTVTRHGRNVWTLAPVPVPGGLALVALRTGAN
jgi:hypothetical protein